VSISDSADRWNTGTGYTGLSLNINISEEVAKPGMTEPGQQEDQEYEEYLGDRILLGNNLPALWYKDSLGDFVGDDETQKLSGINWNAGDGTRYRKTRVQRLDDLGTTNRNGFWERAAAEEPSQRLENKGGLRVVTGAGIYVDGLDVASGAYFPREPRYSFLPREPRYSFLPQPTLGAGIDEPSVRGRAGNHFPTLPFGTGLATFTASGYWVIGPCPG